MKKIKLKKEDEEMLRMILNTYPKMEEDDRYSISFNKKLDKLKERLTEQGVL